LGLVGLTVFIARFAALQDEPTTVHRYIGWAFWVTFAASVLELACSFLILYSRSLQPHKTSNDVRGPRLPTDVMEPVPVAAALLCPPPYAACAGEAACPPQYSPTSGNIIMDDQNSPVSQQPFATVSALCPSYSVLASNTVGNHDSSAQYPQPPYSVSVSC
jgi:hypothetical protein